MKEAKDDIDGEDPHAKELCNFSEINKSTHFCAIL